MVEILTLNLGEDPSSSIRAIRDFFNQRPSFWGHYLISQTSSEERILCELDYRGLREVVYDTIESLTQAALSYLNSDFSWSRSYRLVTRDDITRIFLEKTKTSRASYFGESEEGLSSQKEGLERLETERVELVRQKEELSSLIAELAGLKQQMDGLFLETETHLTSLRSLLQVKTFQGNTQQAQFNSASSVVKGKKKSASNKIAEKKGQLESLLQKRSRLEDVLSTKVKDRKDIEDVLDRLNQSLEQVSAALSKNKEELTQLTALVREEEQKWFSLRREDTKEQ